MPVLVAYKGKNRAYSGKIIRGKSGGQTYEGEPLEGFCAPDMYASHHTWMLNPEALSMLVDAQQELLLQGMSIIIIDAYRSYEQQAAAYKKKPHLCVPPEQSKHVKGIALDLRCAVVDEVFVAEDTDTWGDQDEMAEILEEFGWKRTVMPKEPWHFDFTPTP